MNNEQLNHFSRSPVDLDIGRSVFHRPKRRLTTLNTSQLIPLMAEEVLPGDSVKLKVSSLIRMATPLHPVMDNAVADIHFYFCPNRQVWEHWREFMGENTSSYWTPSVSYTVPQISCPTAGGDNVQGSSVKGFAKGSIGDYLAVPIKRDFGTVSHLPFRHYVNIWNNYYRDQNTMSPANFSTGDSTVAGSNVGDYWAAGGSRIGSYEYYINNGGYVIYAQTGGAPLPVCRLHDRFSSCLPSPQKGPSVLMPLGVKAPVVPDNGTDAHWFSPVWYDSSKVGPVDGVLFGGSNSLLGGTNYDPTDTRTGNVAQLALKADLSQATAASVNSLRNAFMLQRYYEKLARGGSRYFEMIRSFFGVVVPDLTVQIPEFLGGRRFPINMTQVAQTSSTDAVSPQGNLSAYSLTTDVSDDVFTKSFTEHGYLFAVCCIRTEHSYSQGIPRHFSRKQFADFYVPTFANAPEQPIYNRELYVKGDSTDAGVFGYQEAWSEYRYAQPEITGEFRPDYGSGVGLDTYHYGDDYPDTPVLSAGWIAEPLRPFNRTLAVKDHDQFLCDFVFDMTWVRVMPVYSVPGLLDHH